jgi:hypothetical protein
MEPRKSQTARPAPLGKRPWSRLIWIHWRAGRRARRINAVGQLSHRYWLERQVERVDLNALWGVRSRTSALRSMRSTSAESLRINGVNSPEALQKPIPVSEGPGSTRVSRVGLGVPPEPSEPLSARRREQQARRLRSPDLQNLRPCILPSPSKLRGIRPSASNASLR